MMTEYIYTSNELKAKNIPLTPCHGCQYDGKHYRLCDHPDACDSEKSRDFWENTKYSVSGVADCYAA